MTLLSSTAKGSVTSKESASNMGRSELTGSWVLLTFSVATHGRRWIPTLSGSCSFKQPSPPWLALERAQNTLGLVWMGHAQWITVAGISLPSNTPYPPPQSSFHFSSNLPFVSFYYVPQSTPSLWPTGLPGFALGANLLLTLHLSSASRLGSVGGL